MAKGKEYTESYSAVFPAVGLFILKKEEVLGLSPTGDFPDVKFWVPVLIAIMPHMLKTKNIAWSVLYLMPHVFFPEEKTFVLTLAYLIISFFVFRHSRKTYRRNPFMPLGAGLIRFASGRVGISYLDIIYTAAMIAYCITFFTLTSA